MYFLFIQITFFTYFFIFVLKSVCVHLFNNIIYPRLNKYISSDAEKWVINNSNDEWILGTRIYNEKQEISTSKQELLEDVHDVEFVSFKSILNSVIEENTSSFSIMSRSVLLLIYIKMMVINRHIPELLVGLSVGLLMQFLSLSRGLYDYMQRWYFGDRTGMNIHTIIVNKDKIPVKVVGISPMVTVLLVNLMRANIYSRIIGEWIVDLNMFYLYFSQICGYYMIQNSIRIVDYTKHSASILFLVLMYSLLIFLF